MVVKHLEEHGIQVTVLPYCRQAAVGVKGIGLLKKGRLCEAAKVVGYPPMWKTSASGRLNLDWKPGRYAIVPLSAPTFALPPSINALSVELETRSNRSRSSLASNRIEANWIAFVAGPGDSGRLY